MRDTREGNLEAVTERALPFRDRHPVLISGGSTAVLAGLIVFGFWLLAGESVGDTDMNVDVGLALGGASAVFGFVLGALNEAVRRR